MEHEHGRQRLDKHLLGGIHLCGARGRPDAGDDLGLGEVEERVLDRLDVGGLDVELERLVRLERDAVLGTGRFEHAAKLAAKDAGDGRFRGGGGARVGGLALLPHLHPALLRGADGPHDFALHDLVVVERRLETEADGVGGGAVLVDADAKSAEVVIRDAVELLLLLGHLCEQAIGAAGGLCELEGRPALRRDELFVQSVEEKAENSSASSWCPLRI